MLNTKPDPADNHSLRQSISEWRPGGDGAIQKKKEEDSDFTRCRRSEYAMEVKTGRS